MRIKQIVKFSLLFTLILTFMVTTVVAIGGVMKKEKLANSPQWYSVEIIDPLAAQTPANLRITGLASDPPTSSDSECALDNPTDTCMVRLDLQAFGGSATDLINETIAFAQSNNAPVLPLPGDDGYAKHPEED